MAVEAYCPSASVPLPLQKVFEKVNIPIALYIVVALLSLVLALWWTIAHDDISGGFTMGAYVWGVAVFPLGYWHWTVRNRTAQGDIETELQSVSSQE